LTEGDGQSDKKPTRRYLNEEAEGRRSAPGRLVDWGINMEITSVRIFPVDEPKLKAYVTITIDECFVVRDLKIIEGGDGLFVAMPSKRRKDGSFQDIAHPLNMETRDYMERLILDEFDRSRGEPVQEAEEASAT
jgi:stage V sporulation protein G